MPLLTAEYFEKGYNTAHQAWSFKRPPNTELKIPSSCKRNYNSFAEFAANLTAYYNGYNALWVIKGIVAPITDGAVAAFLTLHKSKFQGEQAQNQHEQIQTDSHSFQNDEYCFNRGYAAANQNRSNNQQPITVPKIPYTCKKDLQSFDDFVVKVISYYNGYNKAWTDYGYAAPITIQALEDLFNSNKTYQIIQPLLPLPTRAAAEIVSVAVPVAMDSPKTDETVPANSPSNTEQAFPRNHAQCAKKLVLDPDDVYVTLAELLQEPEEQQPDPEVSLADDALVMSFLNQKAMIGLQESTMDNNDLVVRNSPMKN